MPLRQHLEELRGCVIRAGVVVVVLFAAGMAFDEVFVRFMVQPWTSARESMLAGGLEDPGPLGFIKPTEAFIFTMRVALYFSLLAGGPYVLWEIWRFVGVGLHDHERRAVLRALPWAILLFAAGLAFGFYVVVPLALPILMSWIPAEVAAPTITLQEYLSLLQVLTLLLGVVFELPILMWLVVRAGLVEVATLSASRRVSIIVMLIAAAMLTPPDVITQLLVVAPMVVLYEVGLVLARRAEAARERALL